MKFQMLIALCLAMILLSLNSVRAEEWDFTGERAPSYFDSALNVKYDLQLSCKEHMNLAYSEKFPDYKAQINEPGMREKWRFAMMQHHLETGRDWNSRGAYEVMRQEIWNFSNFERGAKRCVFCGVFGQNLTTEERTIGERMKEVLQLAQDGSWRSMAVFLGASDLVPQLRLLPEIRFYFQELSRHRSKEIFDQLPKENSYFFEDYKTGVPKADMKVIRKAALREDISVVLNEKTTCAKLDL